MSATRVPLERADMFVNIVDNAPALPGCPMHEGLLDGRQGSTILWRPKGRKGVVYGFQIHATELFASPQLWK